MVITVKLRKRADTGDMQNEIRGFTKKDAINGQPSQAATQSPPWKR